MLTLGIIKASVQSNLNMIFIALNLLCLVNLAKGEMPYECHQPLNQSDCGLAPTPVFSYYKPGSRCEIEFWRGCPTFNKFEDQIQCSHHCIFRLLTNFDVGIPDTDTSDDITDTSAQLDAPIQGYSCNETLNTSNCNQEPTEVYTYDTRSDVCTKVIWKGCEGRNMYSDYKACEDNCVPLKLLLQLPEDVLSNIDRNLNNVTDFDKTTKRIRRKKVPGSKVI